jgi:hypothetical protein
MRYAGIKPTTSIFEADFARQTKDPHEPEKSKTPFLGAFSLLLIMGVCIPKGLRPKLLAINA